MDRPGLGGQAESLPQGLQERERQAVEEEQESSHHGCEDGIGEGWGSRRSQGEVGVLTQHWDQSYRFMLPGPSARLLHKRCVSVKGYHVTTCIFSTCQLHWSPGLYQLQETC